MDSEQGTQQEITRLEQEIEERQRRLLELRARSEPVAAETRVEDSGGEVTLASLFGSKNDLLLVHNMGARCPYCTLWADGFNGVVGHIEDRAAFVVCSPDPPDAQRSFAASRGWRFRMVSDCDGSFTRAMGYRTEREGKVFHLPGVSAFRREADGTIRRTGHAPFGPGDSFCGVWHFFDLFEGGAAGWEPKFRYTD